MSKLFVLSAPSGGGKTTVTTQVIAQLAPIVTLTRVTTYTTRPPRSTDIPGVDYHFIDQNDFQERIAQNFFLEWSSAYGAQYGTPRHIIQAVQEGTAHIAVVDRAGVHALTNVYPPAIAIWLDVPSIDILKQRLIHRGSETEQSRAHRLALAQQEIESERANTRYNYRIVNEILPSTIETLKNIILRELGYEQNSINR